MVYYSKEYLFKCWIKNISVKFQILTLRSEQFKLDFGCYQNKKQPTSITIQYLKSDPKDYCFLLACSLS